MSLQKDINAYVTVALHTLKRDLAINIINHIEQRIENGSNAEHIRKQTKLTDTVIEDITNYVTVLVEAKYRDTNAR